MPKEPEIRDVTLYPIDPEAESMIVGGRDDSSVLSTTQLLVGVDDKWLAYTEQPVRAVKVTPVETPAGVALKVNLYRGTGFVRDPSHDGPREPDRKLLTDGDPETG